MNHFFKSIRELAEMLLMLLVVVLMSSSLLAQEPPPPEEAPPEPPPAEISAVQPSGPEKPGMERYQNLIARNPFLPKAAAPVIPTTASPTATYVFNCYFSIPNANVTRIGILNTAENKPYLLSPGEVQDGIQVIEYQIDEHVKEKSATISVNGETMRLLLAEAPSHAIVPVNPSIPSELSPPQGPSPRRRIRIFNRDNK
jgi:hypothetical protein